MKRSRIAALALGVALGTAGMAACTSSPQGTPDADETKPCTQLIQEKAESQGTDASGLEALGCNMLGLDPSGQYTQAQFDAAYDAWENGERPDMPTGDYAPEPETPESTAPEGAQPCTAWEAEAGREQNTVCMESDLWPDTPITEAEFNAYAEVTDCWDWFATHPLDNTSDHYRECDALTDNPPTLDSLR